MPEPACDAMVLFGATGDLATRMIFPALASLVDAHRFDLPLIGVARAGSPFDTARTQALAERVDSAAIARGALERLARQFRYVDGDLQDPQLYRRLKAALGASHRPLFYLAIPPALFAVVVSALAAAGLNAGARIAVEKPFGHDGASARVLEDTLAGVFPPQDIFRIDHFLAKTPVRNLPFLRDANAWLAALWSRRHVARVEVTMAESFGVAMRGAFYDRVGALRDVVQNHLLQVVALLAMEHPRGDDVEAWHDARIAALEAIDPLAPQDVVRGQYAGYRDHPGVAADSRTETYIALRFRLRAPRWRGVPFVVRTGKRLPLTTMEVFVRLRADAPHSDPHVRLRLGPGAVNLGLSARSLRAGAPGQDDASLELTADLGRDEDRDAYVHLIPAVLRRDRSVSERPDGVASAWRIVERVLVPQNAPDVYAPGTWGPAAAARLLSEGDAWHDPAPP